MFSLRESKPVRKLLHENNLVKIHQLYNSFNVNKPKNHFQSIQFITIYKILIKNFNFQWERDVIFN